MTLAILAIIAGFIGLVWSADRFINGAASIAGNLGMPPLLIGLTIVAFGTSAPEVVVSIQAALDNAADLAIGNALGSNLANIGLVLGLTALIVPIPVDRRQLRREYPILLAMTLLAAPLLYDGTLARWEAVVLLIALVACLWTSVTSKSHDPDAELEADVEHLPHHSRGKAWTEFVVGLVLLIISAQILVWGAKEIALAFGVSQLVVGLTVIAVGTSLPELAATIASALKGHHDIAVGNILGSNLFNLLAVMGAAALINPPTLEPAVFERDYLIMTGLTLLLGVILWVGAYWANRARSETQAYQRGRIGRGAGLLLLGCYAAYYVVLFQPVNA